MPTWLYFVAGFIALCVVANLFRRRRIKRLVSSREGDSFDTFRVEFSSDVSDEVLQAVYGIFQRWIDDVVTGFPVRAADYIGKIYEMADEDLEEEVLGVIKELGRRLSPAKGCSKPQPLVTVRDVVCFVASCPKTAEPSAAPDGDERS